jgi:hypothetical protein
VVAGAAADEGLPEVWSTVLHYVAEGRAPLELPYGPYLQPAWHVSAGSIEGNGGLVVWRTPQEPGLYEITLVVSDGVVFVGQQIELIVEEPRASALPGTGPPLVRRE